MEHTGKASWQKERNLPMFRLEKNQIHMVLFLLLAAGIFLFIFFGVGSIPKTKIKSDISGLADFSDGWICTYETGNSSETAGKNSSDTSKKKVTISEIISLPETISMSPGTPVVMTQKLPDYGQENIYLIFQTKDVAIELYCDEQILYTSKKREKNITATHVICIDKEFRGRIVTVKLTGDEKGSLDIQRVSAGTYVNLLSYGWKESGALFVAGLFLLICHIAFLIPWIMIHNVSRQKAVLTYGLWESLFSGLFFILESKLFRLLTGWNFTLFLVEICILIIAMVLHITLIHSSVYKKKILFFTSIGILLYGVLFITVMVLCAFSLITVVAAYKAVKLCVVLGILACTIILLISVYVYGRQEARILSVANGILMAGICCQGIDWILHHENGKGMVYTVVATVFYMLIVLVYGLKQSLIWKQKAGGEEITGEQLRAQMVEQLNPNLLFASFHTLQNLIKNGSSNSVKMIYYISVYLRDNLRAFEHAGEFVTFETEMEHIIAYLQLQKTRNQGLHFAMECKETEFKIPRFSIEPMVENAVKYGIANNENKGNVVVRTYQRAEGYAIQVIDDGIGFDKKTLKRQSPTALLNLFSLLEETCQAQVELISKEGSGTVITIILPMLENDLIKENVDDEG